MHHATAIIRYLRYLRYLAISTYLSISKGGLARSQGTHSPTRADGQAAAVLSVKHERNLHYSNISYSSIRESSDRAIYNLLFSVITDPQ